MLGKSPFAGAFDELIEKHLKGMLPRNIHTDPFSIEPGTTRTKRKYKLLTRRQNDIGLFFFYILTSGHDSSSQRGRVMFVQSDYEMLTLEGPQYSKEVTCSYINLERPFVMTRGEVIEKICRLRNNFGCSGRILQTKFQEIKERAEGMGSHVNVSDETRSIVLASFGLGTLADDVIKKYGL